MSPGSRASTSTSGSRRPFRARSTASTCDVIVAPHTGFGRAALAVGTPWLALSGGPWHEYLCNGVPFMSVHPDTARYPAYAQFDAGALVDDEGEPRTPSMTRARIEEDQPRIVEGARELVNGRLSYEEACGRHFRSLPVAYSGDRSCIFSFDSIHERYILTGASGLSGSEPQALGTEAVSVRSSRSWPPRRDFVAQSH